MLDGSRLHQSPIGLQVLHDVLVGLLDVLTNKVGHLGRELAHLVQGADNLPVLENDPVLEADSVIILTKVWGLQVIMENIINPDC